MISTSPQALAATLERRRQLPGGEDERYSGYGVLGLAFASGHVLAFRRFVASSVGSPFTSIWHRSPRGAWTIYANTDPSQACPRFFGSALDDAIVEEIELDWTGPADLSLSMPRVPFQWAIRLRATAATRAIGGIARLLPRTLWRDERVLSVMGAAAGRALGIGELTLHGHVPNGQRFHLEPRAIWQTEASTAILDGEDLGPISTPSDPALIGHLPLPTRGILAFIDEFSEPFDPERHSGAVTKRRDPRGGPRDGGRARGPVGGGR